MVFFNGRYGFIKPAGTDGSANILFHKSHVDRELLAVVDSGTEVCYLRGLAPDNVRPCAVGVRAA